MSNKSLIFSLAVSVAVHAAVVGLWPNSERHIPQIQESSVEIGMVTLPRIDMDFTRDLSRLQQLAKMIQKTKSGQNIRTTETKFTPGETGARFDLQSVKTISNQILSETLTDNLSESSLTSSLSDSAQKQKTNPATASKAAPIYATNPAPVYPENALRYGWEGEVMLKVVVSRSGTVGHIEIEKSSDYRVLDEAAVNTVRRWQFEPARIGNKTIEGAVSIPIRFQIRRS